MRIDRGYGAENPGRKMSEMDRFWLDQLPDAATYVLRTAGGIRSFTSRFAGDRQPKDWAAHWARLADSISILRVSLAAKAKADAFKQSHIVSYNGMTILLAADFDPSTVLPVPSRIVKCKDGCEVTWNFKTSVPVSELPLKAYLKIRDALRKQYGAQDSSPWWTALAMNETDVMSRSDRLYAWTDLVKPDPLSSALVKLAKRGHLPGAIADRPHVTMTIAFVEWLRTVEPALTVFSVHKIIQNTKRLTGAVAYHRARARGIAFLPLRNTRLALTSAAGPQDWNLNEEWTPMPSPPRRVPARHSASAPTSAIPAA